MDSMLDILNAHRSGLGDPDMVGEELAKARAELRGFYERYLLQLGEGGPVMLAAAADSLRLWRNRAEAGMPAVLDTVDFLVDALRRIELGSPPLPSEVAALPDGTAAQQIASMARRLTGEG